MSQKESNDTTVDKKIKPYTMKYIRVGLLNIGQEPLARMLGMSRQKYGDLESGGCKWGLEDAHDYCELVVDLLQECADPSLFEWSRVPGVEDLADITRKISVHRDAKE